MGAEHSKPSSIFLKGSRQRLSPPSDVNVNNLRTSISTTRSSRSSSDTDIGSEKESNSSTPWYEERNFISIENSANVLPFDDIEFDRQNAMHYVMKLVKGGQNLLTPITEVTKRGGKILDIGCSSGVWCLDTAADYLEADITGIDILPIFPQEIRPTNTTFLQANVLKGLPFPDNTFALVHIRFMNLSLRAEEWPSLLAECVRVCQKDGFIEVVEPDMQPWMGGPIYTKFVSNCNKVLEARGINPYIPRKMRGFMENANIIDIKGNFVSFPVGKWGGRIGELFLTNVRSVAKSTSAVIVGVTGVGPEDFNKELENALEETKHTRGFHNYHTFVGRKA